MKRTIRHLVVDIGKRVAAVFICMALLLSTIGPKQAKAAGVKRHIVMVLETSGSSNFYNSDKTQILYTADSPIVEVKEAALKFADSLKNSKDDVYVSVISYGDYAYTVCDFTNDYDELKTSIQSMYQIGGVKNLGHALETAQEQLNSVADAASIKSLILVSSGLTSGGEYNNTGHWSGSSVGGNWRNSDNLIYLYAYANVAYEYAESIKRSGTKIYSIGITKMMNECPESVRPVAQLFQNVLRDIASENCYYPVYDIDEFTFKFGQMTQEIVAGTAGESDYASINGMADYRTKYYFQDDYFEKGASVYNPSLATMSMCLAMSAFKAQGITDMLQFENAYDLLSDIGFEDIEANPDFYNDPNVDTMGVIVAHKTISNADGRFTLIALATRGAGYHNEWAGNFKVGLAGNHEGFTSAKDVARNFLEWYITKYGNKFEGRVKLWMTGFSRAAATVNLLAGELTNEKKLGQRNTITFGKEDLYAYCFEPPRGLNTSVCLKEDAKTYTNIHNILNPNDFVPKVAMEDWGFIRYGVDEPVIPDMRRDANYNKKAAKMMSYYSAIGGKAINDSFARLSEYENQLDAVFERIVAKAREGYWILCKPALDRAIGNPEEMFETMWNANENTFRTNLAYDYYWGKTSSTTMGVTVDFRKIDGYGMFPTAYDFIAGLYEMRRIATAYNAGTAGYHLTDTISKIDLYYQKNYNGNLQTVKGVLNYLGKDYTIDFSKTQGEDLTDALKIVTDALNSRSNYYNLVQPGLASVLEEVFKEGGQFDGRELKFLSPLGIVWGIAEGIQLIVSGKLSLNTDMVYASVLNKLKSQGIDIDNLLPKEERKNFLKGIRLIAQGVVDFVGTQEGTDLILSLYNQPSNIPMAHYPELCLSWLKSMDSNYSASNTKEYSPTKSRIIYINCPVDVVAKASNGMTVAKFTDDFVKGDESVVLCGVNSDGAKLMYLPTNEEYTVSITAREDCTMSFSVNEKDADEVCDYIENYYDLPMKKGETITVSLPQEFFEDEEGNVTYIEGDNVLKSKNRTVEADVILRGEDAKAALYTVTVENDNAAGGTCTGGGEYVLGNYAMVSAAEYEDCAFIGWYEGDELVSTEREYRFSVTGDRVLSAHFEGESAYGRNGIFRATISAGENGYVASGDDYGTEIAVNALDGYVFEVTAVSKPGYEFDGWEVDGNCTISDAASPTTEITLIDGDVTLIAKFKKYTGEGPTDPTDDPTKPTDDPTKPTDDPTKPTDDPTKPTDDPTKPTETTETGNEEIVAINGVNVSYRTDSSWTGGYNGSITITNNSGRDINDWKMVFDMNGSIAGFWNAEIVKNENGQYFVKNVGWNGKLAKGQSITIGFTAVGNSVVAPANFRVYEKTVQSTGTGTGTGEGESTGTGATCSVEFKTTATWNGGCNGELVITNTSGTALKNWQVTFTCTGQVNSVWNGRIVSRNGQTYVVGDDGSHSTIAPGATIRIGMNLNANGSGAYPKGFTISGK